MTGRRNDDTPRTAGTLVYKILRRDEATRLLSEGRFEGSQDDVADGFVHLSAAGQVEATLDKHFTAESGLFLGIARAEALGEALRWEPSRNGALFPHLYRALEIADILALTPIPDTREGWRIPTIADAPNASIGRGN